MQHRPSVPNGTELRASLQQALVETDHQIGLLGSVAWWYLLPSAIVVVLILCGTLLGARAEMGPVVWARSRAVIVPAMALMACLTGVMFWLVWRANQRAVRRHLRPHRDTIAGLIRHLSEVDKTGHP